MIERKGWGSIVAIAALLAVGAAQAAEEPKAAPETPKTLIWRVEHHLMLPQAIISDGRVAARWIGEHLHVSCPAPVTPTKEAE